MKITSIHLCEYTFEDLYQLIDQDLTAQGLRRTNKAPVSRMVEGKEIWVFEATSTAVPGPVKPKGKGGRRKKIVTEETEKEESTEVVATTSAPFPV